MPRVPRTSATDGQDGDLHAWLQRYGAMAPPQALRLVAELGAELGAMHKQGRVHGAVEPANVLLTARDGILGGHLRDAESALNEDRAYIAPERHHDPAATSRGDIYALGCLLWACLTGAPPYPVAGHATLHLAGGEPAPRELEALLEGMLRTDPVDRFSSAAEIGREAAWIADRIDAGRHVASVPRAAPATTSTSPWKNIGMVGVVGLSLLAIAVGGYAVVNLVDKAPAPPQAAPTRPTETAPALAPVAPATPAVVEKPTFTCWNGRTVAKKRKCREPEGITGMYWIFPLLKGQNCRPRLADSTPGRRTLLECYFYGRQVRLDVSLWQDTPSGVSHYASAEGLGSPVTGAGPNGRPATYAWETTIRHRGHRGHRGHRFVTVRLWMKHAYSVAVYARQRTLAEAVRNSGYYTPVPDNRYYGYLND